MIIYSGFQFSLVLSKIKNFEIYTKHNIIIFAEENFQLFEKLLNCKYKFLNIQTATSLLVQIYLPTPDVCLGFKFSAFH